MNEIIKISNGSIGGAVRPTVNGRDLHSGLDAGRDFSNWIKLQITWARLVENRDFVCSPVLGSKGRGGHNAKDYHLTLVSSSAIIIPTTLVGVHAGAGRAISY